MQQARVYAIATMDTKGIELAYVVERLTAAGHSVVSVDVGTLHEPVCTPDIDRLQVARCHPNGEEAVLNQTDRGQAVASMSVALERFIEQEYAAGRIAAAIGLGGTGGTALIAPALRGLPIGLPKVLISTVAAGNVAAYVGCSDLLMFPSIVDVAGVNRVSRKVFSNAVGALSGMLAVQGEEISTGRPTVAMTMFGVTTPCVDLVRKLLEARGFDCLVFHATGVGGRTMEKLVEAGYLQGVLDITTTEVADQVVGGIFPAGIGRFDAILAARIPYVVSVGALDMVNFAAADSVPTQFIGRRLHGHNPNITLMRTTADENRQFARWMAAKFNRSQSPLTILLPQLGISSLDAPGQPFHDPVADEALFAELELAIQTTEDRVVRRLDLHINDAAFAKALVAAFENSWNASHPAAIGNTLD